MNESEYITKLRTRFLERNPGGFFYKIPDAHDGQQRPFDGFFSLKGKPTTFFEAKFHKSLSPWHFGTIEPHQIKNLRHVQSLGNRAFVVVGMRALTTKFDRKRLPKPLSQIYADIWIPVHLIPGEGKEIEVDKLDVRSLMSSLGDNLKGNKVHAIYLHKERFERYVQVS